MSGEVYALVKQQRESLTRLFDAPTFKQILPRLLNQYGMSPETFVEFGYMAFSGNEDLIRATPESKLRALLEAARLGLVPDGRLAVIVPRKRQLEKGNNQSWITEAKLQTMYQGETEMVRRLIPFRRFHSEPVRANDHFKYRPSALDNPIDHEFDPKLSESARGELVCVYSFCVLIDGAYHHRVLNQEEVYRARASSKSFKDYPGSSPWTLHEPEMWRKTSVRKLAKDLPRTKGLPWEGPTVDDFLTGMALIPEDKQRKGVAESLIEKLSDPTDDPPIGVATEEQEGVSSLRPDEGAGGEDSTP